MTSSPANSTSITRLAATVMMLRDGDDGLEVFMVVRHHEIDFAAGALVFPGGKLAPGDQDARMQLRCTGIEGLPPEAIALRVAAIREAFEECGMLLARTPGARDLIGPERLAVLGPRYRKRLDKGDIAMADVLEAENLELACEQLVPFAHWITPIGMPKRFDTHFYLAVAPANQLGTHDGTEVVDSLWLSPKTALSQAEAGVHTLVPATELNVRKLGFSDTVESAIRAARSQEIVTVVPQVVKGPQGRRLLIPAEAGYGITEFTPPKPLKQAKNN